MPVDLDALYPKLIGLMLDTVFVVDRSNHIVFVSDACEELLGYSAQELIGTPIMNYMYPEDIPNTRASIAQIMRGKPSSDFRNRYIHKSGAIVHILWSTRWSEEDAVRIGVARNITALRQAEEKLMFLAHHDPLTGLTNRSLFNDRLHLAVRLARRHSTKLALLFVDINDFKAVNDTYGHAAGDQVLCAVARRLEACVREVDTVARLGGDEFIVLLTDIQSADDVAKKVQQIVALMAEPLASAISGLHMPSCSIGVACYPDHGRDIDALLKYADAAMYCHKTSHAAAD